MHLFEIVRLRAVPAAGLFMALTRRCPLSCAHCSTNSQLTSEEHPADPFLRFADSFTPTNHPDVLLLTGGEPLLRPRLVQALADKAHAVGTKVSLISGMFFARQPEVPELIANALAGVDHFTASLDAFHEREVPRSAVFRALHWLLDQSKDVSLQVVGLDEDDPYLVDITGQIQRQFGSRVPVFVSKVGAVGRAADWLEAGAPSPAEAPSLSPCLMAAWPVIAFDGTILGCCNQQVIDGPAPSHLRLGDAAIDGWPAIRARVEESHWLRALRLYGPQYLARRYGNGKAACDGYCATCHRLADDPSLTEGLAPHMDRPAIRFMGAHVIRMQQEGAHGGLPAYAHLVQLGYQPGRGEEDGPSETGAG